MGSSVSKTNKNQKLKECSEKGVKEVNYRKLHEDSDSCSDDEKIAVKTRKPRRKDKRKSAETVRLRTPLPETDELSTGDAIQVDQVNTIDLEDVEEGEEALSLSMTTQVSPKCYEALQEVDSDDDRSESPLKPHLFPKVSNRAKRKNAMTAELCPLSDGRLGNKRDVRKHLEKQGLLKAKNAEAIGEGIMGELRGVGIIKAIHSTDDTAFILPDANNKRRLPSRLPILPVARGSLSTRIVEKKFELHKQKDEPTIAKPIHDAIGLFPSNVEDPSSAENTATNDDMKLKTAFEINKLKIKLANIELM